MHLLLHVTAFRELTFSVDKVSRLTEIFKRLDGNQNFGVNFFPVLTYLSAYLPWIKYISGGIIKDGDVVLKLMSDWKELNECILSLITERLAKNANSQAGKQPIDDQMQVLIDEGDGAYALIYVCDLHSLSYGFNSAMYLVHSDSFILRHA